MYAAASTPPRNHRTIAERDEFGDWRHPSDEIWEALADQKSN